MLRRFAPQHDTGEGGMGRLPAAPGRGQECRQRPGSCTADRIPGRCRSPGRPVTLSDQYPPPVILSEAKDLLPSHTKSTKKDPSSLTLLRMTGEGKCHPERSEGSSPTLLQAPTEDASSLRSSAWHRGRRDGSPPAVPGGSLNRAGPAGAGARGRSENLGGTGQAEPTPEGALRQGAVSLPKHNRQLLRTALDGRAAGGQARLVPAGLDRIIRARPPGRSARRKRWYDANR